MMFQNKNEEESWSRVCVFVCVCCAVTFAQASREQVSRGKKKIVKNKIKIKLKHYKK